MIHLETICEAIKKSDNFLITAHLDPEPDALGSELAVYELVTKLGKKAVIINDEKVPEHYKFLEGVDIIKTEPEDADLLESAIVLDCPTVVRAGKVKKYLKKIKNVINIDHHISNEKFGAANWVKPDASSTAEMVYFIYKRMGVDISKRVALYIYIAILTDTGSFNYSNTSSVTHEVVSELLGYGLSPHIISNYVYESKAYADIKLLGKVLSTMTLTGRGKISYVVCTNEMIKKTGSSMSATQDFVNFARSINGVIVSMIIREEEGKKNSFKISMRSKNDVSVNAIAAHFGGGGHKYAAGCRMKGTLKDVKKKLITRINEEIKKIQANLAA